MSTPELHIDVLIFGGGIAGLWTLARLRREGYSCILLESKALGAGQTIASQGIIHGGIKYALTGKASAASKAIAEMPGIWRACLRGEGEIDLRAARVLSEHQYLWTAPGLLGRVAGFGASIAMRGGVDRVTGEAVPEPLRAAHRGADVYRVEEPVLDARSVVGAIVDQCRDSIFAYPGVQCLRSDPSDGVYTCPAISILNAPGGAPALRIIPGFVLVAAGASIPALAEQLGGPALPPTQLRPLHMVMARGAPGPLFAHCVSASTLPRLTITSGRAVDGSWVWYIGGAIAEAEGVARSHEAQIEAARHELAECLPGLALSGLKFATMRVDRAEAVNRLQTPAQRPDEPKIVGERSFAVAWPTKLAFAPVVAARVLEWVRPLLEQSGKVVKRIQMADLLPPDSPIAPAAIAPHPWDREDLTWT